MKPSGKGSPGSTTSVERPVIHAWPEIVGVKPALSLKAGHAAWGPLGEGDSSLEGSEPTRYGPHWGAQGTAAAADAVTFVSEAALRAGIARRLGTGRRLVPVRGTRGLTRD